MGTPYILLETTRLSLRQFTEADLDHLFELDNDPEVMRFLNGGIPVARKTIKKELLPVFLQYDKQHPGFGFWAAIEKISGDFLGWFSFRPVDANCKEVILGFRFIRKAWGKGYATEGASGLIQKGFDEMDVERVVATTYEKNLASQRVMEKIGMTFVRRFRITQEGVANADTYHVGSLELWEGDDLEFALEKSGWKRNQ